MIEKTDSIKYALATIAILGQPPRFPPLFHIGAEGRGFFDSVRVFGQDVIGCQGQRYTQHQDERRQRDNPDFEFHGISPLLADNPQREENRMRVHSRCSQLQYKNGMILQI